MALPQQIPQSRNPILTIVRILPLLAFSLIAYVTLIYTRVDLSPTGEPLFYLALVSGGVYEGRIADLLLLSSLVLLFFEIVKSTWFTGTTMFEHIASTVVFIIYLVMFLTWKEAANPTFLMLMAFSLIDVIGGFVITAMVARRDIALH